MPIRVPAKPTALERAQGAAQIDLRAMNVRAVDAEERLAGMHVLPRLADEQLFDKPLRSHGDDRQAGVVMLDVTDGADRSNDRAGFYSLVACAASLTLVDVD